MRVSVVIPTTRPTTIEPAVRSIQRQTFQDWELIVVGQGDEQLLRKTVLAAGDGDPRVRYVHLDRYGASAARNAGTDAGTGEIIAFIDDDCEADADWLEQLDKRFQPSIGLVAGTVVPPTKKAKFFAVCPHVTPEEVVFDPATTTPPPGFGLLGANMAVLRTAASRIGRWDECLGPGAQFRGGEEHDYARRLMRLGVVMCSTPHSIVHHTYGYRYGIRSIYRHKRERLRGDGALEAKQLMLGNPTGGLVIKQCVRRVAIAQLRTASILRLPNSVLRLYHYLTSFRECLRDFVLSTDTAADPSTAVLVPRVDTLSRSLTGPRVDR
jgi:glycosyltransferase involved in cell wall biosynthesis